MDIRVRSYLRGSPQNVTTRKFMIFAPWADQGLGIQARHYAHWLGKILCYDILIYSCQPSKATIKNARLQADPKEWGGIDVIYISQSREEVNPMNVVSIAKEHDVTDVLLLEVRFNNMFRIAAALKLSKIRVFAVPNIELVRRCEVSRFDSEVFTAILCNNMYTVDILKYMGVGEHHLRPFPFIISGKMNHVEKKCIGPHQPMRFLLVGGMNSVRRKQADKVIRAFSQIIQEPTYATLTVTCQGVERVNSQNRAIRIVHAHLTHSDILDLYKSHHIVFMCSRAEGIGISMHEALFYGCAVLALNTPLNRELIKNNINGWLLPHVAESGADGAKLIGNDDPIVRTHTFEQDKLATLIKFIIESRLSVNEAMRNARQIYDKMRETVLNHLKTALLIPDEGTKKTTRIHPPNLYP